MRVRASLVLLAMMLCVAGADSAWAGQPSLGTNASFNGFRFFPSNSLWNKDISGDAVDLYSDSIMAYFATISLHPDFSIPYTIVSGSQRRVKVTISDPGQSEAMMLPIPPNVSIEGGGDGGPGDSHICVFDRDNYVLYEIYATSKERQNGGKNFTTDCCAVFNAAGTNVLRPKYWTSCDAAGLPVLPGLMRADEVVERGAINHALRFTVVNSRHAFLPPATHWASSKTGVQYPPMGCKFRLKASVDISYYPSQAHVIAQALKTYGLILADNGGDLYMTGAPDARWNMSSMSFISGLTGNQFELVQMVGLVTSGG